MSEQLLDFVELEPGSEEDADFIEVWVRRHELNGMQPRRVGMLQLLRTDDHAPYRWMFHGESGGYMREEHLVEVLRKITQLHG